MDVEGEEDEEGNVSWDASDDAHGNEDDEDEADHS